MDRKQYPKEFKEMIVALLNEGQSSGVVSKEYGLNDSMVNRWRREFNDRSKPSFTGQGNARHNRPVQTDFIFHSDRGVQYASKAFTTIVQNNLNVRQRMSRKANCWDNAVAESFFKTIKCELLNHQKFNHIQQLKRVVFEYIQWYNNHRIHQSLDYQTPNEVEKQFLTKSANVA